MDDGARQGTIERISGFDEDTKGFNLGDWLQKEETDLGDPILIQKLRAKVQPIYDSFEKSANGNIVDEADAQSFIDQAREALAELAKEHMLEVAARRKAAEAKQAESDSQMKPLTEAERQQLVEAMESLNQDYKGFNLDDFMRSLQTLAAFSA